MEQLFEIWEITEMKDGCVYKTHNTGETRWVPFGEKPSEGTLYVAMSSSYTGPTIREK